MVQAIPITQAKWQNEKKEVFAKEKKKFSNEKKLFENSIKWANEIYISEREKYQIVHYKLVIMA